MLFQQDIYQSKLDQLNGLFGDVHHIEIDQNSLKDPSTWEWLNECMARLFIHSRLYQCSRFYGKRIYLENKCPGGCELRKISKQKSRDKFKSVSKKISNIRALSIKQTRAWGNPTNPVRHVGAWALKCDTKQVNYVINLILCIINISIWNNNFVDFVFFNYFNILALLRT